MIADANRTLPTCFSLLLTMACCLLAACPPDEKTSVPPEYVPPPTVEVVVLAEDLDDPRALAVDANHVYFAHGSLVRRVPKGGGLVEDLVALTGQITSMAKDGDTLFVGSAGEGVHRVAGGRIVRIAKSGNPRFISVDARRVWYWDEGVFHVARDVEGTEVARAAGTASPKLPFAGTLRATGVEVGRVPLFVASRGHGDMVADETHVYFVDGGILRRRAKDSGTEEDFAHLGVGRVDVALDDDHVYWADGELEVVLRRPKVGGPAELVTNGAGLASAIAVDDDALYVCTISGELHRIAKADRTRVLLTHSATNAFNRDGLSLVADDDALFLGVYAWRWDATGIVVIGDGTKAPELLPLGEVVRSSKRLPETTAAPTVEPGPTAWRNLGGWFGGGGATLDEDDRNRLELWHGRLPDFVEDAIGAGTLPLHVTGEAEDAEALALVRARADSVAAALRELVGEHASVVIDARVVSAGMGAQLSVAAAELGVIVVPRVDGVGTAPESVPAPRSSPDITGVEEASFLRTLHLLVDAPVGGHEAAAWSAAGPVVVERRPEGDRLLRWPDPANPPKTRWRTKGSITQVVASPDGKTLALHVSYRTSGTGISATYDGEVVFLSAAGGPPRVAVSRKHSVPVDSSLVWSPDGTRLAVEAGGRVTVVNRASLAKTRLSRLPPDTTPLMWDARGLFIEELDYGIDGIDLLGILRVKRLGAGSVGEAVESPGAMSPGGRWHVLWSEGGVRIAPARDAGPEREVSTKGSWTFGHGGWTSTRIPEWLGPNRLVVDAQVVDLRTGDVRELRSHPHVGFIAASPDGTGVLGHGAGERYVWSRVEP